MARHKEFNKKEVLEKAKLLFWTKGFHATSMQNLVDEMGISRASLYDTFGGKQALYTATLKNYQEEQIQLISNYLGSSNPTKDALDKLMQKMIRTSLYEPEHKGDFILKATAEIFDTNEDARLIITRHDEELEMLFYQFFKRMKFKDKQDIEVIAKYFFIAFKGFKLSLISDTNLNNLAQSKDSILGMLP